MRSHQLAPIEVRGVTFNVTVNDEGTFHATHNDVMFGAPSLDGLKDKLGDAMRATRVKVNVPFVKPDYDYRTGRTILLHGEGTGIHAGNGGVLVRWQDGKHESWASYSATNQVLRPLSPLEETTLLGLALAQNEAKKNYDDYIEMHTFNLHQAVKAAVLAATDDKKGKTD